MNQATNPYLHSARLKKAVTLTTILHAYGITSDLASKAPDGFWPELSRLLGLRSPSPDTIKLVLNLLDKLDHPPDVMAPFKKG